MHTLRAGPLEADIVPDAGMVVASLRLRGGELLGLRAGLDAYRERGATFGVPLLYPFANRLSEVRCPRIDASAAKVDANGLPLHGLPAGRGPFAVQEATDARIHAVLDFDDPAFPPAHRVHVTHELDPTGLRVTTRVEGEGVPIAFGWHPYLAVDRASTPISLPAMRRHLLDGRGLPTGATQDVAAFDGPLGQRTYDDLFEAPAEPRFRAGGVAIRFEAGARWVQVFAPAAQELIAFEPMTAPTNALVSGVDLPSSDERGYVLRFRIELA